MHRCVGVCTLQHLCVYESEENVQNVFSFYFWVLEIKFRLSTLMTSTSFTQPSC